MHFFVPVLPIKLTNELPIFSVSPNKLVAVSLIVAVNILFLSLVI